MRKSERIGDIAFVSLMVEIALLIIFCFINSAVTTIVIATILIVAIAIVIINVVYYNTNLGVTTCFVVILGSFIALVYQGDVTGSEGLCIVMGAIALMVGINIAFIANSVDG
ncbi:hypothetical protein KKA89_02900 [Patescibacteria group bacterium]|nr:hypothetical protein [Patescibacteria group bacterium]MBU2416908.1 hypothetical protein [Patescibacteria group bacterium]